MTDKDKGGGSLSDRLLGGLGWIALGTGMQALVRLGTLVVLARLITPSEFGLFAAVMTVVNISEILGNVGLAPALIQRKDIDRVDMMTAQTLSVCLATTFTVLVWLFADAIAALFVMPAIVPYLRAVAVIFFMQGLTALAKARMSRDLHFSKAAKVASASVVLGYSAVVLPLAWLGWGVWALVIAQIGQSLVTLLLYSLYYPPLLGFRFSLSSARRLLSFGIGYSSSTAVARIAGEADYVIVGRLLGAEALGVYSRAFLLIVQQTKRLGQTFSFVLFPVLSSIQDQQERLESGYGRSMTGAVFGAALITVPVCILSEWIVLLMLGPQWTAAVVPFALLGLGIVPRTANRINAALFQASARLWTSTALQLSNLTLLIAACLIAAPYGLNAVAGAVTGVAWLNFAVFTAVIVRAQRMRQSLLLGYFLPGLLGAAIITLLALLGRWLAVGIGAGFWAEGGLLLLSMLLALPIVLILPGRILGPHGDWLRSFIIAKLRRKKALKHK
ncbi:MAG: hypothetical protein CMH12_18430 [Maritimibacter sp.]|nr:hypothetical protein [Maritimibacter sp.]